MQVVWTQKAIRHLAGIRSYIERDKLEAARQVAERIILASEYLAIHPNKGHPGRKAGTRELVILNTPYILPYKVQGDTLTVLAVFHGAQQR